MTETAQRVTPPPDEPPLPDPSARLTAALREVARRMEGLGFVNQALEVEAVAFEPWQGHWLGVMVTPWFMNLVLLPRQPSRWQALPSSSAEPRVDSCVRAGWRRRRR